MPHGAKIFRAGDVPESNSTSYPAPFALEQAKRHFRRVAAFGGLTNYGVNLVRVEPGGQSAARHAHLTQDEIVLVLDGELVLETDAGHETVGTGTWIAFPKGTGDGHRFLNESQGDATFMVVGDKTPDKVTYPDIDLYGEHDQGGTFRYFHKNGRPY